MKASHFLGLWLEWGGWDKGIGGTFSRLHTNRKGLWGPTAGSVGAGRVRWWEGGVESGLSGVRGSWNCIVPSSEKMLPALCPTFPSGNLPSSPSTATRSLVLHNWVIPVSGPQFPIWSCSENHRDTRDGGDGAGEHQDPRPQFPTYCNHCMSVSTTV